MKKCNKCLSHKLLNLFPKRKESPDGHRNICRECTYQTGRISSSKYYLKTRESKLLYGAKYRENNKESLAQYAKHYLTKNKESIAKRYRERRKSDPIFRLSSSLRRRLNRALKSKRWVHGSKFSIYIGCSPQFLREYLESKFKLGMTWNNHGSGVGKWQIDHMIPLLAAKTEQEIYKLSHYTNLQPLWTEEHKEKTKKDVSS